MAVEMLPIDPRDKLRMKQFIMLPWKIYENDPAWVPPLIMERKEHLDPSKNPFFDYGKAQYFLAVDGDRPVGRISAHLNPLHNERYNDKVGFFGFFECIDDPSVARQLLDTAEDWLKGQGMDTSRGPLSFTINDEVGVLVEGFEYPQKFLMAHSPPYYAKLITDSGYQKAMEMYAWDYISGEVNPMAEKIAQRVQDLEGLVIREVDPSQMAREVGIITDVFNSAWSKNWGFVPFTKQEMAKIAKDLKMILDPRLALVAEYKGEPIAISIAFPDLNQVIKDLNGRLFPFGLLKLIWRVKRRKYTDARLALLGIKKEHRGGVLGGLSVALYVRMHKTSRTLGHRGGELGWTLETNEKINRGIELMGGRVYKRYRVYDKPLG